MFSERQRKLQILFMQAWHQQSHWLVHFLRDKRLKEFPQYTLSRTVCLRVLVARNRSGLPFEAKRRAVRAEFGV